MKDVNLEIRDQEFMVLVGPSGCGKTTTLRMVAGLESITSGQVLIGDTVVNELRADGPRHRHGVPELRALSAHERLRQHGLRPEDAANSPARRSTGACRRRPTSSASATISSASRASSPAGNASASRWAAPSCAIRKVFLFDEPLSNLDAKLRVQMRVEIKKIHDRLGTTAIYVTHDQVEAMTLGDRVVVMKDGLVQQVGEPLELYNAPANRFVAGFIGSPAMNFAEVRVDEEDGAICAVGEGMRFEAAAADRRAAARPCGARSRSASGRRI